ncbi:FAD/NAD(P)-binding protein [Kineosporia succinea]|uniref:NAD(P)/FAD-binding protein YdhS n=1 Tax=Kineosporia succinea TaxID=84632 RepID=A0ABT9PAE5_9ACTN|nr:FAD/NAD(P)-binding protein [Kineosporia succinea]MDP9829648.1 putative NAD(P)/FAD-binding protein YdhS [Kineosporia succinea]
MSPGPTHPSVVVVVGGGLGGTATAVRLLGSARAPVEVQIWERRPELRSAGPAYHREGNPWNHIFNIQAGRMSLFREDTFDFIRWANTEADRTGWPAEWREQEFLEHSPAPRRIFQDYLEQRLERARRDAAPGVVLTEVHGRIDDLVPDDTGVRVSGRAFPPGSAAGEERTLRADYVVLATGLELRTPAYAARVRDHPAYLREPYTRRGVRTLENLPSGARVLIVGSVLSAYDTTTLLLRRGHTGDIYLTSGSGSSLRAYPEQHAHEVIELPAPAFADADFASRSRFLEAVGREWRTACARARASHPDLPEAIVSERVAKAWEPHTPAVLSHLATPLLRSLLQEFSTAVATLRVGAMRQAVSPVDDAVASGEQVHRLVGTVEDIRPASGDGLVVRLVHRDGQTREMACDLVVDSFGRQPDYTKAGSPLWRNLLAAGTAVPHERTGRGLEVDEYGHPVRRDGTPAHRVALVGCLREGDEIIRNGRSGAFSLNLAAIKNHSLSVVVDILDALEEPRTAAGPGVEQVREALFARPGTPAGDLALRARDLEIRRLSVQGRGDRETLSADLAACIDSLALRPWPPGATRPLLTVAIRREALQALCDVSVTPKDLTGILGLEPVI